MAEKRRVVIVSDGQFAWGADRDELFSALGELGWESDSSGSYWQEPESDPFAYDELCLRVRQVPGFDDLTEASEAWDELPSFTWQSGLHRWVFEEAR